MENNHIIHPELIFLDVELKSKEQIIQKIAQKALEIGYLNDEVSFYQSVMEREAEVPTAIGYDIAIPHGKTEAVNAPFIAFVRSKEAFQWTEGFAEEAQLIFQIGVPGTGTEKLHLKFISQVSKKLLDEAFRKKLLVSTNKEEIFQLLKAIEA